MADESTATCGEGFNCVACDRPDAWCDLVQCEDCLNWWHQRCAGVTGSIKDHPWSCRNCIPASSAASKSTTGSAKARALTLQLAKLNEMRDAERKNLELKSQSDLAYIQQKYSILEEKLELDAEDDLPSGRSRISRKNAQANVVEWVRKQTGQEDGAVGVEDQQAAALPDEMQSCKANEMNQSHDKGAIPKHSPKPPLLERSAADRQKSNPMPLIPELTTPKLPSSKQLLLKGNLFIPKPQLMGQPKPRFPPTKLHLLVRDSVPSGTPNVAKTPRASGKSLLTTPGESDSIDINEDQDEIQPCLSEDGNLQSLVQQLGLGPADIPNIKQQYTHCAPSSSQLAARQVMPRDLPSFSGNPADWPVFISNFTTTTLACGYSPAENLIRLQRCLKGPALETVRSRLLLPESVPHIIETLRLLYGRPELLINALLAKVRSVPAPKAEKLESLIDFGIAVQGLCDHLEAANQRAHLSNPSLLLELVDKLPVHVRLDWAAYTREVAEVNLQDFGEFMSEVVRNASRVTLYSGVVKICEENSKSRRGTLNVHTDSEHPSNSSVPEKSCPACSGKDHRLKDCDRFKSYNVDGRWKLLQNTGICRNCLNFHGRRACRLNSVCGSANAENHVHRCSEQAILFRIVPITLHGPEVDIETFAFLDDGSSLTLIESALVEQLGVGGDPQPLCLKWTGNMSRLEKASMIVQLAVSGCNTQQLEMKDVRTVKNLNLPRQTLDIEQLSSKHQHLRNLPIFSYYDAEPRILIGINNLRLMVPLQVKEGDVGEPVAVRTRLGWSVYGGTKSRETIPSLNYHDCQCSTDETLHNIVKDYFAKEDVGTHPHHALESDEEKRARYIMEHSTVRVGDRFETGLIWRYDNFEFPDSFSMALKRLECLERRMARNPVLKANLFRQIKEYEDKGYSNRVSEAELLEADPRRVWYLPLGAIIHPRKPEKVRMIWDASAKVDGISLNEMLLKGPDQLTVLPAVLFRFRQFSIAVSADIEEMFHRVLIRREDRHAQRYLFRSDPSKPPEVYIMNVATFGSACPPASAQYVKNLNASEFAESHPRAVEGVLKSHYVDDYLDSFPNEHEAKQVSADVRMIHTAGGFNIRGWRSNSKVVLEHLDEHTLSQPKYLNMDGAVNYTRVLGLLWLPEEDLLSFSVVLHKDLQNLIDKKEYPTKRLVLRVLMSFFDPLGMLAPFIIQGKILLQQIWRSGVKWDERIDSEAFMRWRQWTGLFPLVNNVRIPRCYFDSSTADHYNRMELHIFVDASEEAYAAVAYFRIVPPDGDIKVALVAAKTKVAPLKPMSIPRLELQAAVLGIRLMKFILESHPVKIARRVLHSDSSTFLSWIRCDPRRYKQYVALRVAEVLSESEVDEWRWVPSKMNPADIATKWGHGPPLDPDHEWYRGYKFMKLPETTWPPQRVAIPITEEEIRSCYTHHGISIPTPVVNFNRFSRWPTLLRGLAYVFRYVSNLHRRIKKQDTTAGYLTQEELRKAETHLIRMTQWEVYSDEMVTLHGNQHLSPERRQPLEKNSTLNKLTPVLDENGILRVDSRLNTAKNIAMETKFPIILPKKHPLAYLIVDHFHRQYRHANSETVVNEVRQLYNIPQLRPLVKNVARNCQECKIAKSMPRIPRMAPLPNARLALFTRPFTYVGVDLFGPLLVKLGRSNVKRWVALYTCLTTRAVHVEVVYNLSTEAFVMSMRRFVARRGSPVEVYSDNGTNFQGANRLLQEQIQKIAEGMAATFTNTTTRWVFNPPGAPHMGGAWERLVRSIKVAMAAVNSSGRKLDDEGLLTLIVEAESIVNSRPLTQQQWCSSAGSCHNR
ncbi:uncharacterized protein LOC131686971 [Topomyia yanbarensis]|uniref:uncharacterized protein LOC131686971 n=1 Tax=Topomyia yanbarensis TaxID=2498891 RepID=UPI00273AC25A|nr:uncharacterized protein LOC131686971 [Topomyia yanbarensis]